MNTPEAPKSLREKIRDAIKVGPEHRAPTAYEKAILHGLQFKPTYGGTVDPAVVADRRRRNRAARKSRRINRLAAQR